MSEKATLVVAPHTLPALKWEPTQNMSSRHGHHVRMVVVHRWGMKFTTEHAEEATYEGVINYFKQSKSQVSAHIVYPGSAKPGEATQMVPWHMKAWAESYYNPDCVEVESADAIWSGHDPHGWHQLAHIVAWMLHHWNLPPTALDSHGVVHGAGFCRHYDLGALGGGHSCPTTDDHLWASFSHLVISEYHRGHGRDHWGRV
jgi:N-acetylmuramoyl-L-alanine amidase